MRLMSLLRVSMPSPQGTGDELQMPIARSCDKIIIESHSVCTGLVGGVSSSHLRLVLYRRVIGIRSSTLPFAHIDSSSEGSRVNLP